MKRHQAPRRARLYVMRFELSLKPRRTPKLERFCCRGCSRAVFDPGKCTKGVAWWECGSRTGVHARSIVLCAPGVVPQARAWVCLLSCGACVCVVELFSCVVLLSRSATLSHSRSFLFSLWRRVCVCPAPCTTFDAACPCAQEPCGRPARVCVHIELRLARAPRPLPSQRARLPCRASQPPVPPLPRLFRGLRRTSGPRRRPTCHSRGSASRGGRSCE